MEIAAPYVSARCDTCYSCTDWWTTTFPCELLAPHTVNKIISISISSNQPHYLLANRFRRSKIIVIRIESLNAGTVQHWIHLAGAASSCTALSHRSVSWTISYEEVCGVGLQYRHNVIQFIFIETTVNSLYSI